MKTIIRTYTIIAASLFLFACGNSNKEEKNHKKEEEKEHHEHGEGHEEEVHFSEQQFKSLNMKVDTLAVRNISSYVEANGQLEVSPQNEAAVTAVIGANITQIKVIEGNKVKKGQVLAYLSHPNLIQLQTNYVSNWNQLQYLQQEYQRQKKLYEEKVGSGKEFQKIQAEYQAITGKVKGDEAQLKLMGLNIKKIRNNEIYGEVPVISPIDGHIQLVEVKIGQYVDPQKEMFEIVNIDHIHADLMVFEKDIHKVKENQKIRFKVTSLPGKEMEAVIYSIGKSFESSPKAIHIHAEIENKEGLLIPGMYVRGQIISENTQSYALPDRGVVREADKYFIFTAKQENDNGKIEWAFEPVEVAIGAKGDGWTEIKLLKPLKKGQKIAQNNAYYLMAEMKKGEAEHSH